MTLKTGGLSPCHTGRWAIPWYLGTNGTWSHDFPFTRQALWPSLLFTRPAWLCHAQEKDNFRLFELGTLANLITRGESSRMLSGCSTIWANSPLQPPFIRGSLKIAMTRLLVIHAPHFASPTFQFWFRQTRNATRRSKDLKPHLRKLCAQMTNCISYRLASSAPNMAVPWFHHEYFSVHVRD